MLWWAVPVGAAQLAQVATASAAETIVLRRPAPGKVVTIPARLGQRLIVAFKSDSVVTIADGPNLGLWFPPKGGWIVLTGLGRLVDKPGAPVFVLKGGVKYTSAKVFKTAQRARQNNYRNAFGGRGYSAGTGRGPPPVPRASSTARSKEAPREALKRKKLTRIQPKSVPAPQATAPPQPLAKAAPRTLTREKLTRIQPKLAPQPQATAPPQPLAKAAPRTLTREKLTRSQPKLAPSPPAAARSEAMRAPQVPKADQPDSAEAPPPAPAPEGQRAQGLNRGSSVTGAIGRIIGDERSWRSTSVPREAPAAEAEVEEMREEAPAPEPETAAGVAAGAGAMLSEFAPDEPVYNVEIDEKLQARPLVLAHDRPTKVRFHIGPRAAESVIPAIEAGEALERLAAGRPLELAVTLDCLVCIEATYFRGAVTYDPATRRSDQATFLIRPSRAAVATSGGYGLLILSVDVDGLDLAVIKVPVFVDTVSPAIAARLVAPPPVTFVRPDVEADVIPDLVIDIGSGVGKLPIGLNPVNPDLKAAMAAATRGRDMARPFESGVTTADLADLVAELYKALRAVVEQNAVAIQAIYAARGDDLRLGSSATRLRFSDADKAKTLGALRRPGADLYRRVFMDGDPDLRRAMRALYRYYESAGRPLRIRMRATNIYAPWQMLYGAPNRKPARADGFWGFRYQLATLQKVNAAHAAQGRRTFLPTPRPNEILFGSWRGDDDVGDRAREMQIRLANMIGGQPLLAQSRSEFLGMLDRYSRSVKLILFYGHATSGTVMLPNETAIASALSAQPSLVTDWTGERLLFANNDLLVPRDIQDLVPYETYDDEINPVFFKNRPIVVLNACETGTGGTEPMNNNGFIGRFSLAGASAVFVTEAPVWRNFAYHFGNDLVREITAGQPMQAALFTVRRRHLELSGNPLGLLYSLYGNPSLRIEAAPGRPPGG